MQHEYPTSFPLGPMNTITDLASYAQLLVNPFDSAPVSIPDEDPTPHIVKTINYNQNIAIARGSGFFVWPAHGLYAAIRQYGYDPSSGTTNLLALLPPDQDLSLDYLKGRHIAGGIQLVSNTIAGGAFAVSGAFSAVAYSSLPPITTLSPADLTQYKMDNISVLGSVPTAEGVIAIAPLSETRIYQHFSTVDQSLAVTPVPMGENQITTGGPDDYFGVYRSNTYGPITPVPAVGTPIVLLDFTPNDAGMNSLIPLPQPYGNVFFDGTITVRFYFNNPGPANFPVPVGSLTYEIQTADPGTYAQTFTTYNTNFDGGSSSVNNAVPPGLNFVDVTYNIDWWDYLSAELSNITFQINAIDPLFVSYQIKNSTFFKVRYADYYRQNYKEPGIIVAYTSVTPGQQMCIMGKSHWELTPNYQLSRNLSSFYNIDDTLKYEAARMWLINNYGVNFKFVYARLDFLGRTNTQFFRPTNEQIIYHAATFSEKFLTLLKRIGTVMARPTIGALGGAIGMITNPALGAAVTNAGLLMYDGWRGTPPAAAPYRASTAKYHSHTRQMELDFMSQAWDMFADRFASPPPPAVELPPMPPPRMTPPATMQIPDIEDLGEVFQVSDIDGERIVYQPRINARSYFGHTIADSDYDADLDEPMFPLDEEIMDDQDDFDSGLDQRWQHSHARYHSSTRKVKLSEVLERTSSPTVVVEHIPQAAESVSVSMLSKRDTYAAMKADCITNPRREKWKQLFTELQRKHGAVVFTQLIPMTTVEGGIATWVCLSSLPFVDKVGGTYAYRTIGTVQNIRMHLAKNILGDHSDILALLTENPTMMLTNWNEMVTNEMFITVVPQDYGIDDIDGKSWHTAFLLAANGTPATILTSGTPTGEAAIGLDDKAAVALEENMFLFIIHPLAEEFRALVEVLRVQAPLVGAAPYNLRFYPQGQANANTILGMPRQMTTIPTIMNEAFAISRAGINVKVVTGVKETEAQEARLVQMKSKEVQSASDQHVQGFLVKFRNLGVDTPSELGLTESTVNVDNPDLKELFAELGYPGLDNVEDIRIFNLFNTDNYKTLANMVAGYMTWANAQLKKKENVAKNLSQQGVSGAKARKVSARANNNIFKRFANK